MGIEPTEPGTQAPQGFEDPGGHQSPIQPHDIVSRPVQVYTEKKICARKGLASKEKQQSLSLKEHSLKTKVKRQAIREGV